MWRQDVGEPAGLLAAHDSMLAGPRPRRRGAWGARRRQRYVADGLCSVARLAAPNARRRRSELMLVARAALVRSELLEIAVLVRQTTEPDSKCIAELHRLLTSGCDSPLYNLAVPVQALWQMLERARSTLSGHVGPGHPDPRASRRAIGASRRPANG
jgi:hypothetical protein